MYNESAKEMRKGLRWLKNYIRYIYVCLWRDKYYDSKYFQSVQFSTLESDGWRWAAYDIWHRRKFGVSGGVRWPKSPYMQCGPNIEFDVDDLGIFFQSGNYFQTINGKIHIGCGTFFAKNIGVITTNHNLDDLSAHQDGKDVYIGSKCWIGMNVMILPGVKLGDHTVVGAGSVVTKSFEEGNCIIAGNPARVIKKLSE